MNVELLGNNSNCGLCRDCLNSLLHSWVLLFVSAFSHLHPPHAGGWEARLKLLISLSHTSPLVLPVPRFAFLKMAPCSHGFSVNKNCPSPSFSLQDLCPTCHPQLETPSTSFLPVHYQWFPLRPTSQSSL